MNRTLGFLLSCAACGPGGTVDLPFVHLMVDVDVVCAQHGCTKASESNDAPFFNRIRRDAGFEQVARCTPPEGMVLLDADVRFNDATPAQHWSYQAPVGGSQATIGGELRGPTLYTIDMTGAMTLLAIPDGGGHTDLDAGVLVARYGVENNWVTERHRVVEIGVRPVDWGDTYFACQPGHESTWP